MEIIFSPQAIEDRAYWKKSGNKIMQKKILQLLISVKKTPFEGIGKPELLKHNHSGKWSRRINQEHRLIYKVEDQTVTIIAMRFHY